MCTLELLSRIASLYIEYCTVSPISGLLLSVYLFYQLYLLCAGIFIGWRQLPLWVKVIELPIGALMLVVDVILNYTIATALFWQPPPSRCWTITQRISFYKNATPNTWRGRLGRYICRNLLDPAQLGGHCS